MDLLSKDPCKQGFLLQWWKSQDIVDVVELSEIFLSDLIINQRKSSVTESHGLGSFCLHVKATGQAEKTDIFCERKEKWQTTVLWRMFLCFSFEMYCNLFSFEINERMLQDEETRGQFFKSVIFFQWYRWIGRWGRASWWTFLLAFTRIIYQRQKWIMQWKFKPIHQI